VRGLASLLLAAALATLAACGSGASATGGSAADDAAIASDFQAHASKVEVTADGVVVAIFSDRRSSTGTHEQFIIRLTSQNMTVEVEHDISIGRRVPLTQGDHVIVHGEYIWNSQGGLIHFTHHDPQGTHEGGYIIDHGTTYD
jgi:hypothetical protein